MIAQTRLRFPAMQSSQVSDARGIDALAQEPAVGAEHVVELRGMGVLERGRWARIAGAHQVV
jgi:hypothetical protein